MGFDPVSLALFAFQAVSAIKGFKAQQDEADAIKESNSAALKASKTEARLTREDAARKAEEERKEAARVRGQQLALFLKSGVTLEGSPLLVADETTREGEKNAQNTIDTAEARARSTILRGRANQRSVPKPDIFGTGASILGAGQSAKDAGAFGK